MKLKITYYLDVISSWCYWAEPAWLELKEHFANAGVEFTWKIALMDESGLPKSRSQIEWFYRRSGTIVGSHFMLNSGWYEPELKEYLAPNLVVEAARELGVSDDRVRLAVAHAAMREGHKVGRWDVACAVAATAGGLEARALEERARSREIENRARASTAEFHALHVNQRPAFLLENDIGDRAVFSGLVRAEPIAAAMEAMLEDSAAYASFAAHFGSPPER